MPRCCCLSALPFPLLQVLPLRLLAANATFGGSNGCLVTVVGWLIVNFLVLLGHFGAGCAALFLTAAVQPAACCTLMCLTTLLCSTVLCLAVPLVRCCDVARRFAAVLCHSTPLCLAAPLLFCTLLLCFTTTAVCHAFPAAASLVTAARRYCHLLLIQWLLGHTRWADH